MSSYMIRRAIPDVEFDESQRPLVSVNGAGESAAQQAAAKVDDLSLSDPANPIWEDFGLLTDTDEFAVGVLSARDTVPDQGDNLVVDTVSQFYRGRICELAINGWRILPGSAADQLVRPIGSFEVRTEVLR